MQFKRLGGRKMKNKNYSIRLSEPMADFLVEQGRKMSMLPSEYLRYLIQKEMERTGYQYGKQD